jgi:UDP-N-acetyl-2-amino-2-deoxyglucuronate dehydrogenase
MKSFPKLKVGQIGVGNYGAHRRFLMRQTGLFDLAAAYDLNPKAMAAAGAEDGAQPTSSYEELLDFPGLEAVVISTGAMFHAEQMVAALNRGLHVFVEKPLCATPVDITRLFEARDRSGCVVVVGHRDHCSDAVSQTIADLIQRGELGEVVSVEKTAAHSGGWHIHPGDWRGDPDKNPGGMLFQCGVHALHELMSYFGPIEEVFSWMRYDLHTTRTADAAVCQLRFASGLLGSLNAYHLTPYRHTMSIFGTKASLYRDERHFDEGTILQIQRLRLDNQWEPKEPVPLMGQTDESGALRNFYAAVREGAKPSPSLEDGARAVAVVFAADESARTGQPQPVEKFYPTVNEESLLALA